MNYLRALTLSYLCIHCLTVTPVWAQGRTSDWRMPTAGEDVYPVADPSIPHSLDAFLSHALANNPTLAQARAYVSASRGKALQAGLYYNPNVGYIGDQIGTEGTAGEFQGMFIEQEIVTANKLGLSRAKYRQEVMETRIELFAQTLRVENGVRLAYVNVLATQRMVALHQEMLKNADEAFRTNKEMHNTGQSTRADVLMAEVALNRARIDLTRIQNRRLAAWRHLLALSAMPCYPLVEVEGALERCGPPLDFCSSLTRLMEESPELQRAWTHIQHDRIMVRREQAQPVPNLFVEGNTGFNFENNTQVAGMGLRVEVPLWNQNQGSVQQARADLARSQAEVRRLEFALRQQLAEQFNHYLSALAQVELYRDSTLPKSAEALALLEEMYRVRRIAWPEVVELRSEVLDLRSEYTNSLLELRQAETVINGLLIVDGLSQPRAPEPGGHLEATPRPR